MPSPFWAASCCLRWLGQVRRRCAMSRVTPERLQELLKHAEEFGKFRVYASEVRELEAAIPKRYVHGELCFHAHLWITPVSGETEPCELCARFQAISGPEQGLPVDDGRARSESERTFDQMPGVSHVDLRDVEGVVPVVTCHFVEDGQDVVRVVPSLVRLQTLDDCDGSGVNAREPSAALRSDECIPRGLTLFRGGLRFQERERVVLSRGLVARFCKRPDQMLEDGATVVQTLSNRDSEPLRKQLDLADI